MGWNRADQSFRRGTDRRPKYHWIESARHTRFHTDLLPVDRLVLGADLGATALFAVEGAIASIDVRLDLFGVLVVAFATALGGGIIRDVVIGSGPPVSLRFSRYPLVAFAGGALVFLLATPLRGIPEWLLVTLDAGGLSLFAVSGARRALDFELNAVSATLLGVLTGVGGGILQALLLNRVPSVLSENIYASAALFGAGVMVIGVRRGGAPGRMMLIGAVLCFALRMISFWQGWNLPTIGG